MSFYFIILKQINFKEHKMKKIPNKKMAQIDSMYEIEKVLKNTQYKISEVLTPDGNNILHYLMLKENKNDFLKEICEQDINIFRYMLSNYNYNGLSPFHYAVNANAYENIKLALEVDNSFVEQCFSFPNADVDVSIPMLYHVFNYHDKKTLILLNTYGLDASDYGKEYIIDAFENAFKKTNDINKFLDFTNELFRLSNYEVNDNTYNFINKIINSDKAYKIYQDNGELSKKFLDMMIDTNYHKSSYDNQDNAIKIIEKMIYNNTTTNILKLVYDNEKTKIADSVFKAIVNMSINIHDSISTHTLELVNQIVKIENNKNKQKEIEEVNSFSKIFTNLLDRMDFENENNQINIKKLTLVYLDNIDDKDIAVKVFDEVKNRYKLSDIDMKNFTTDIKLSNNIMYIDEKEKVEQYLNHVEEVKFPSIKEEKEVSLSDSFNFF